MRRRVSVESEPGRHQGQKGIHPLCIHRSAPLCLLCASLCSGYALHAHGYFEGQCVVLCACA